MKKIIVAILIAQLASLAQQTSETPKGVKFQSTSQLVVVNVSAKGKNGETLNGLTASDFTVTEDGKPQQLKVFEYQRMQDAVLEASEPTVRPTAPLKSATPIAIAPSKSGEVKYKDRRLLVLFFDQAGM